MKVRKASSTIQQIIRDQVTNLIRDHGEIRVDLLIEYLWADETIASIYGFPEQIVRATLEKLESDSVISWDRNADIVSINMASPHDYFEHLSKPRTPGKWELTIIGRNYRSNGDPIDLLALWDILKETSIGIGEFRPHFSENLNRIEASWAISGVECGCYWSSDSFYIHSIMFEEPRREVLEYIAKQPEPTPSFLLKAIPFSAAYLLYEHMKHIAGMIHPDIIFEIGKIRASSTKEEI